MSRYSLLVTGKNSKSCLQRQMPISPTLAQVESSSAGRCRRMERRLWRGGWHLSRSDEVFFVAAVDVVDVAVVVAAVATEEEELPFPSISSSGKETRFFLEAPSSIAEGAEAAAEAGAGRAEEPSSRAAAALAATSASAASAASASEEGGERLLLLFSAPPAPPPPEASTPSSSHFLHERTLMLAMTISSTQEKMWVSAIEKMKTFDFFFEKEKEGGGGEERKKSENFAQKGVGGNSKLKEEEEEKKLPHCGLRGAP